jgi:uncharacterized protein YegL
MPNKNRTDIILLIDRSGSMAGIRGPMVEGMEKFLREQAESPAPCFVSTFYFSDPPVQPDLDMVDVHTKPHVRLVPTGNTALIDAMCWTITRMMKKFEKIPEDDKPGKVVFVCVTDGQENASRVHSPGELKELVEKRKDDDKWEFVYLGANQDAFKVSSAFSVGRDQTMNYAATTAGVATASATLSASTMAYRSGITSRIVLTKDEKKKEKTE